MKKMRLSSWGVQLWAVVEGIFIKKACDAPSYFNLILNNHELNVF